MKFTTISPLVLSSRAKRHRPMLSPSLKWMNDEFGRYIRETDEVPWFYNERSVLGFFISGLVRKGDAVVLQEFSCYKGKGQSKKRKLGRADLYFNLKGSDYLAEAKWGYTLVNTRSEIDGAVKWAKQGLYQANQYAKDAKVKKANVFSMCFEVIYCSATKYDDYTEDIKAWKIKDTNELCGLDYYSLIEASATVHKKFYRYKNEFYPALAVYGLFNQ